MQGVYSSRELSLRLELDVAEAAQAIVVWVGGDADVEHGPTLREQRLDILLRRLPGEIPEKGLETSFGGRIVTQQKSRIWIFLITRVACRW